jgi:hypothetical protein
MNIKLTNVRLSFPQLFEAKAFGDAAGAADSDKRYEATFILDKKTNAADIQTIRDSIKKLLNDAYNGNPPKGFKLCFHDGIEKEETDGYGAGVMYVSSSSPGNKPRPPIVDRDLTNLEEKDGKPYAGCYVNASLRLWVQDNKWGKRVNAQYRTVQFYKHGEQFGEAVANPTEEFEALEPLDADEVLGDEDDAAGVL